MDWKIIAASIAGTSHVAKDLPCDDSFARETAGEHLILAVSDGAGSAARGKDGAEFVCRHFADGVKNLFESGGSMANFEPDFARAMIKILQKKLTQHAADAAQNVSDFSCTLLAAVIGKDAAAFFQIGDGGMVYAVEENDDFQLFTQPQQGEYANSTFFVTDETAIDSLKFARLDQKITRAAIFTDGLQRIVLNLQTGVPHAPFFRPMFAPLGGTARVEDLEKRLADFLDSKTINERTDDDKTLILAARQ